LGFLGRAGVVSVEAWVCLGRKMGRKILLERKGKKGEELLLNETSVFQFFLNEKNLILFFL